MFIEGVQSLSFKKFKLDRGRGYVAAAGLLGSTRIWYYASQGLVVNSHFLRGEGGHERARPRSSNALDVKYDLFNQVDTARR